MPERTCVTDCGRGGKLTRGMCTRCYRYWLDHTPPDRRPVAPRFAAQFDDYITKRHERGCWTWTGKRARKGYGVWRGHHLAHRHSWERTNGPIPADLWVLHHCDNPPCVNPAHLYLGTNAENTQDRTDRGRGHRPTKTHCKRGHELAGDNLRIFPSGERRCRTCDNQRCREWQRARRQRAKAAA